MPTYRSIAVSLISQFDVLTIPEYEPPTDCNDPFVSFPPLIDPDHSLVSVYIPTYPSSQFWISYSISAPRPPKALYYFKLFLNGASIVSWGCGEEDDYKGKTMFGIFDAGRNEKGVKKFEKRVLSFSAGSELERLNRTTHGDVMELKVYRSKGRKRVKPEIDGFRDAQPEIEKLENEAVSEKTANGGVSLINAGFLHRENPQRFYKYALVDPLDQPFATFRYYYRSWDELERLGVASPCSSRAQLSIDVPSALTNHSVPQRKLSTSKEMILSPSSTSIQDQQTQLEESGDSPLRIPPAVAPELFQRLISRPNYAPIPLTNPSFRHTSVNRSNISISQSKTTEHALVPAGNSNDNEGDGGSHSKAREQSGNQAIKNKVLFGSRVAELVNPQDPVRLTATDGLNPDLSGYAKQKRNMGMLNGLIGSTVRRKNKSGENR